MTVMNFNKPIISIFRCRKNLLHLRNTTGVSPWMKVPGVFLHLARSTNHSQCAEDVGQAKLGLVDATGVSPW